MAWIGVDLDGTLAHYGGWVGPDHIGEPVPAMVARVRTWLAEGKEVRIFTARAATPEFIPDIHAWCLKHLGTVLQVTNVKDFAMIALYDDRCVQVEANTGRLIGTDNRSTPTSAIIVGGRLLRPGETIAQAQAAIEAGEQARG